MEVKISVSIFFFNDISAYIKKTIYNKVINSNGANDLICFHNVILSVMVYFLSFFLSFFINLHINQIKSSKSNRFRVALSKKKSDFIYFKYN